jgi:3-hydroxyisobutyrate dehydrogenase
VLDGDEVIGFVGLGRMGQAIAARLLEANRELIVWNRSAEACDTLVEGGAEMADTLGELVERADLVLLCLGDAAAVEDVVFGEDGVAAFGSDDQMLVDLSSIDPAQTCRFARELGQLCGMAWVDAPVAGDIQAAEEGRLLVFAGGHEDDIERVRPLLECVARRVTRMGDTGAGQVAKLCHQMLAGAAALALAETIAFAERSGIDAERLPGALADGYADSLTLQVFGPRMAVRQFEPVIARLGTLARDIDAGVTAARAAGAAVPFTALAAQLLRQHALRTPPDEDLATLIELYSE